MSDVLDINQGHSLEEFLSSLSETIKWCSNNLIDYRSLALRSAKLAPEPLAGSRKDVVQSVITLRGRLIRHNILRKSFALKEEDHNPSPNKTPGRLLAYEPDNNLADGAAANETFGFFDDNNVPPWDLWVAYIYEKQKMGYLVCWIPDQYMSLAQSGIDVNPEQCIYWLDESKNDFTKLIKETMKDMQ